MKSRKLVGLAIPLVWAAGMFAARFDPRIAIASAAAVLVGAVLATDSVRIAALLRPTLRLLIIGVLAGAVMIAVTDGAFAALVRLYPTLRGMSAEIYRRFVDTHTTAATLAFVVPIVFAEEILWRGAFQDVLSVRSPLARVLFCAAIYAAAHAPFGSPLLVLVAFVCGLYWSALRAASGSVVPSLVAHLAWDIALITIRMLPLH